VSKRVEVAAAVIERPDGSFLMASRPPGKVYAGWWEFPGGKIEPGETARHALDRELHEELGLEVETAYPWLNRAFDYEHARVMLRFFRVTSWRGTPHPHEGQEQLAWVHDAAAPDVAPILTANGPILKGLSLPLVYGISSATELGSNEFLRRLDAALARGLRLVQLREKDLAKTELAELAKAVADRCTAHGARLMINGDSALANDLLNSLPAGPASRHSHVGGNPVNIWAPAFAGATKPGIGIHLTSLQLMALAARPDLEWVGASCHNASELARAAELELDFVVLGPVLPTASHPGAPHLGWDRFEALIRDYPLPVFALGGLTHADLDAARRRGAHGIALKSGAWSTT
jgi:8-oxo-dGTP diphosphatase